MLNAGKSVEVDWESVIKQLPRAQAQALKICAHIDEGNIEAAAQIAQSSSSAAIKSLYVERVEYLFSTWSHDPLVRHLSVQTKSELIHNSHALADFFDCILARDMIKSALSRAWDIRCNAPQVVKDALYALCDTTKEGQLFCTPALINQRLDGIISKASPQDRAALVEAFYLPNGVLKDFADHTVVKALKMPTSILQYDGVQDRKILNDLVVSQVTARSQTEQLVAMRGIANVKYALSFPMPKRMKGVLLKSAELVCKSLEYQAHGFVNKYMVDAEHYKHLAKPVQVVAQTEVGGAKNVLLDKGLSCIARRQFDKACCHEYQLKGMEHAVVLIKRGLSKHALQLCYKIITADPKKFSKELPKFTTVVQEDKNQWIERDMQGNVIRVSNDPMKDRITRQAKRYARAAIKEFGGLPEITAKEFDGRHNDGFHNPSRKSSTIPAGGAGGPPNDPRNNRFKSNNARLCKDEIDSKITKVNNMKEFFQTDFGSTLKGKVQKTNQTFQGQAVYEVTAKIPHALLKKGDLLYLDALHKDHLEVFFGRGKFKAVLNLDGSLNDKKTNIAQLQNRVLR